MLCVTDRPTDEDFNKIVQQGKVTKKVKYVSEWICLLCVPDNKMNMLTVWKMLLKQRMRKIAMLNINIFCWLKKTKKTLLFLLALIAVLLEHQGLYQFCVVVFQDTLHYLRHLRIKGLALHFHRFTDDNNNMAVGTWRLLTRDFPAAELQPSSLYLSHAFKLADPSWTESKLFGRQSSRWQIHRSRQNGGLVSSWRSPDLTRSGCFPTL